MFALISSAWVRMSKPATLPLPAAGPQDAAEHADGGGLAGPVRPEKAEDLAPAHLETDVVDGDEAAETAGQVFDLHRCFTRRPGPGGREEGPLILAGPGRGPAIPVEDTDKDVFQRRAGRPDLIAGQSGLGDEPPGLGLGFPDIAADHVDRIAEDLGAEHGEPALQEEEDFSGLTAADGQYPALHQSLDFIRAADSEQPAPVKEADPVAALGLVEVGGGDEDRHPSCRSW